MNRRPSEEGLLDYNYELGTTTSSSSVDNQQEDGANGPEYVHEDNISTPRMWTLSLVFAAFGSSLNLLFSLRYPSVTISPIIAILLAHPLGLLWDKAFSDSLEGFHRVSSQVIEDDSDLNSPTQSHANEHSDSTKIQRISKWHRMKAWLGQGSWNEKEHCCVFIASNVSFGFAFATDVIVEQIKFYNQEVSISYQLLLTISTQILGFAIAGLTRAFLVRPKGMVWPGTLVAKAMFLSLHKNENKPAGNWAISRFRFFSYITLGSSLFYLLPGFLIPALSYFNVITWIAPDNVLLANIFGVSSGLGLFPLTFDWSQIAYIGSPLVVPFWATLNIICGLIVMFWILAPIVYYSNTLYTSYMPILSATVFDNTGHPYNVTRILTKDFVFDQSAYADYSRVFLPATYILSYALQFAALPALIVHAICWYRRDLWNQCKESLEVAKVGVSKEYLSRAGSTLISRQNSVASDLSQPSTAPVLDNLLNEEELETSLDDVQDDVPNSWYLMIGIIMTAIGIFVVEGYDVNLPWYGLFLAIGMCTILIVPAGIIQAITNQHTSLYLVAQLLAGSLFKGRPVANLIFVTYSYITSSQGLKFASDLKLGQMYMKIPPRILLKVQLVSTLVSSFTQIGVLNWMLINIPSLCSVDAINGFTCPFARVHFNGSILWGVIGPHHFFGTGELYQPLVWAFLVGAIAPFIGWLFARRSTLWSKVNFPVLFGSLSWIPPATALNFSVWAVICYIFNYRIRRSHLAWWEKYNMTLSAALDSGLAIGVLVVFFGLVYPGFTKGFKWWGTEVYKQGCDWKACPYKPLPKQGRFGPEHW